MRRWQKTRLFMASSSKREGLHFSAPLLTLCNYKSNVSYFAQEKYALRIQVTVKSTT